MTAIDTMINTVIATIPIGQAPQALNYVSNAVPSGDGKSGLQPLGIAGQVTHLLLASSGRNKRDGAAALTPTSVSLFDQGLTQVLQASVRTTAASAVCPRAGKSAQRSRQTGAAVRVHDEPGGICNRQ